MATGDGKPPSLDADIDMADLASLDPLGGPASSAAGAPSTRFRPRAKGKPMPKPDPKPKVEPPKPKVEPETPPPAPPPEDGLDAMEVDVAGDDAAGFAEGGEDFVVREIDVYFTPRPFDEDTKLYIMQYPLKPCWRPFDETREEVRVKPLSSEVEMDVSIHSESENYDPDVSASQRIAKQTLSSSKAAGVADYAVGVLQGNLVHLNHIHTVLQLRPSMAYMNSPQETDCAANGSVVPSVKGKECAQDSKEDSEPWVSLTYQPAGSDIATKYHDKMIANEGGPIDFTMSKSGYVMSLCPGASTGRKRISKCQAIREMSSIPMVDRLKKWFTEVSEVNQFGALMHLLAPTYSEEEVLKALPEYADLVRGLWVCKSSLLFDDGYASKRDRVLLEFTKKDSVPSNLVDTVIKPSDPMRNRILFPLCRRREILKDYKFISVADLSFVKRYPHVANEQERAWSAREITIRESQEIRSTQGRARHNVPSRGRHPNRSRGRGGPAQASRE